MRCGKWPHRIANIRHDGVSGMSRVGSEFTLPYSIDRRKNHRYIICTKTHIAPASSCNIQPTWFFHFVRSGKTTLGSDTTIVGDATNGLKGHCWFCRPVPSQIACYLLHFANVLLQQQLIFNARLLEVRPRARRSKIEFWGLKQMRISPLASVIYQAEQFRTELIAFAVWKVLLSESDRENWVKTEEP